jgi:hypothetical protein
MKTVYVSFRRHDVAAVKLVDRPPFLDSFAATIHHRDLGDGSSSVEYKYSFQRGHSACGGCCTR